MQEAPLYAMRLAYLSDVPAMIELAHERRLQYEHYQPVFWRVAEDAREKQQPFFEQLVSNEDVITLVCEQEKVLVGFLIATLVPAPPVYNPGGLTCMIDDFCVARESIWAEVGIPLLQEAAQQAKRRGAAQTVVVCGHRDELKRSMLATAGFSIASEWYVQSM